MTVPHVLYFQPDNEQLSKEDLDGSGGSDDNQTANMILRPKILLLTLMLPGVLSAAPQAEREVIDTYCVTCHSEALLTAGLDLTQIDAGDVGRDAETWELEKAPVYHIID